MLSLAVPVPCPAANEAIAKLQESTDPNVQDILSNTTKLQALLMYHVVPGATLSANRIKNMTSTSKTGAQPYKTMEGEKINATVVGDSILVDGEALRAGRGGCLPLVGVSLCARTCF